VSLDQLLEFDPKSIKIQIRARKEAEAERQKQREALKAERQKQQDLRQLARLIEKYPQRLEEV